MYRVMAGVRVLEVAQFTFVPAAGAVLADWGAEVLKVEHPVSGDSQRALLGPPSKDGAAAINFLMEHANRGKRSIGLDLANPEGREILYELARKSDVFLTNFLPAARRKLGIDLDQIRTANPDIIYARGSAFGDRGPEREKGGYDSTAFWARGGSGMGNKQPGDGPAMQPGAAYGDSLGGMTIAGGIAGALFARERTGRTSVVDISLLGTGVWAMGCSLTGAMLSGGGTGIPAGASFMNPLVGLYAAKDGGFLMLTMLQGYPYWADTCEHLGRPELVRDPRFETAEKFAEHADEAIQELRATFATATLEEWRERFATLRGQWGPFQTLPQIETDPEVLANAYVVPVEAADGSSYRLVASPGQFDEQPPELVRGPAHAEHTEPVLQELGLDADRILELRRSGVVG